MSIWTILFFVLLWLDRRLYPVSRGWRLNPLTTTIRGHFSGPALCDWCAHRLGGIDF